MITKIMGASQALLAALFMAGEIVVGTNCYNEFTERNFALTGTLAAVWGIITAIKKLISKSH